MRETLWHYNPDPLSSPHATASLLSHSAIRMGGTALTASTYGSRREWNTGLNFFDLYKYIQARMGA